MSDYRSTAGTDFTSVTPASSGRVDLVEHVAVYTLSALGNQKPAQQILADNPRRVEYVVHNQSSIVVYVGPTSLIDGGSSNVFPILPYAKYRSRSRAAVYATSNGGGVVAVAEETAL